MVSDQGGPVLAAEQTSVSTFERLGTTGRAAVYGEEIGGVPEDSSGDGGQDGATSDQQDHMTDYSEHEEEFKSERDEVMLLGYHDTARAVLEYIDDCVAGHGTVSELDRILWFMETVEDKIHTESHLLAWQEHVRTAIDWLIESGELSKYEMGPHPIGERMLSRNSIPGC